MVVERDILPIELADRLVERLRHLNSESSVGGVCRSCAVGSRFWAEQAEDHVDGNPFHKEFLERYPG